MRRTLLPLTFALVALAVVPGLAAAKQTGGAEDRAYCAPAGPPQPGQCSYPGFAVGSTITFDLDASSGPLGEDPTGSFRYDIPPFFEEVQVTCLQVTGNVAHVGGIVTASPTPGAVGFGRAITVSDGPDLISQLSILPTPPTPDTPLCGSPFPPTQPVTGDVVVQDAICNDIKDKPGTDKDKCKDKDKTSGKP